MDKMGSTVFNAINCADVTEFSIHFASPPIIIIGVLQSLTFYPLNCQITKDLGFLFLPYLYIV